MNVRYVMGTFLRIEAAGAQADEAREALFSRIQRLEERLSFFLEGSDISFINGAAGRAPVEVSADAFDAVSSALRLAEATAGAFDPTFRSERPDFRRVELKGRAIFLPEKGMLLDLGGFAKGWSLDRALEEVAPAYEVAQLVFDFGGQLQFWSASGHFPPRPIAVEDPRDDARLLASFSVDSNASVATSSQGQRPGHLRDPRTGETASGCLSATAVAATGAEAEALSTALFVLGPSAAERLLPRFPGARAIVR